MNRALRPVGYAAGRDSRMEWTLLDDLQEECLRGQYLIAAQAVEALDQ